MTDKQKDNEEKLKWLKAEIHKGMNSGPGIPLEEVRRHFRERYTTNKS